MLASRYFPDGIPRIVVQVGASAVGGVILYKVVQGIRRSLHRQRLRNAVSAFIAKRDERIAGLDAFLQSKMLLPDDVNEIVDLTLIELVDALQNERLSPVQVLHAYQYQAVAAHRATNCITEFVESAQPHALELEVMFGGKDKKPPLYGVPVSVKESVQMKGFISTRGYANAILENDVASEDAYIITLLMSLGAVPFCRTNVPQTLLSFNCSNPVYGATTNPKSKDRTPGGSSGGEAALIALKGSIIGLGGDVGGSIRIPSHFSGITGFKPGSNRFTQVGSQGSIPGRPCVTSSIGPMARNPEDLVFFMKTILNRELFDLDPLVSPVVFRNEIFESKRKLTIGLYYDNGVFEAVPACVEAVRKAREALEARGHDVIEVSPYKHKEGISLFYAACLIDGGHYLIRNLSKDLPEPSYRRMIQLMSMPKCLVNLALFFQRLRSPSEAAVQQELFKDTVRLRQIYERHETYRREFVMDWQSQGFDAVICPANASVAMYHKGPARAPAAVSYTSIYNLLDFPAGVVQTHTVSEADILGLEDYAKRDPEPMKQVVVRNNRDTLGLPAAAQVVALPNREEMCLKVMCEIKAGVKMIEEWPSIEASSMES